ncbi:Predicted oxidoreductase [Jatrophihabitans endophyticus]|uniref:Predicted oxidoreductase n=1 Tax=Jatrophihabitans endophyticus TaxID=1206085 RepID=A0A1M5L273_9ACTN|nr:aldo/keto reductase [Jatrophihabitans endophyticus]SHG58523.1 Predicted oxidoreductase [Jatrophihabitans endophyticus]
MDTGRLGRHTVNRVGFGAMQLEHADHATAVAVLRRAVGLGVDHVDTADFYGEDGLVNGLLRQALHPYDGIAVATKVGAVRAGGSLVAAQRPAQLRDQVEANLRRLDTDRLAVVNLRRVDGGAGIRATGDQVVPIQDQLAELVAMRDEGKLDGIGLSNVSREQLRVAEAAGIVCVQNHYSLLERADDDLLADAAARDVAWVPFFPLGSGFAGRPKVTDLPEVRATAQRFGATPAQVGLAWLLARDPHVLLIPGTGSVDHLGENVAAAGLELDDAAIAALSRSARTVE